MTTGVPHFDFANQTTAVRFPDESLAVRIAASQRWEVWRTW